MKRIAALLSLAALVLGCHTAPDKTSTDGLGQGGAGSSTTGTGASTSSGSTDPAKLPFAVDDYFAASGYMGDGESPGGISDSTACPERAGDALGVCHHLVWTPKSNGWAGIYWQYPAGNWGTSPGYQIEPGATQVSFWAWGDAGGETLSFFAGIEEADGFHTEVTDVVLTTTPTRYYLNLRNKTYDTVVGAFGWSSGTSDGTSPVSFTIDDIQWQNEEGPVAGCSDPDAANYDPTTTSDDGSCQYGVTFQVDMNGVALAATDIVYVQSTFNQWCGNCNPMTDSDQDGIWTVTLPLKPGTYEYKYTTNGWDGLIEDVPLACDVTGGQFGNRGFTLDTAPLTLPLHAFGVCAEGGDGCTDSDAINYDPSAQNDNGSCLYDVTFQVDMTAVALAPADVVTLQSTFNVWCGDCNPMSDADQDNIWTVTLPLKAGSYEYKYTTNGWNGLVETVPLACDVTGGQFQNRGFDLGPQPTTLPLHAFSECPAP